MEAGNFQNHDLEIVVDKKKFHPLGQPIGRPQASMTNTISHKLSIDNVVLMLHANFIDIGQKCCQMLLKTNAHNICSPLVSTFAKHHLNKTRSI